MPASDAAPVIVCNVSSLSAVAWARRGVKLAPRNASTHVVLGDALAATGNEKAATAEWRAARTLDPENADAASRLKDGK